MKNSMLVAASALIVGLGVSGAAYAQNTDPPSVQAFSAAVAASEQGGASLFNGATGSLTNQTVGTVNGTGLINVQQNGGANSTVSDANTLGAILSSTSAPGGSYQVGDGALSLSSQVAVVAGSSSKGAAHTTSSGSTYTNAYYAKSSQHASGFEESAGYEQSSSHQQSAGGSLIAGYEESSGGHHGIIFGVGAGGGGGQQSAGFVAASGHEESSSKEQSAGAEQAAAFNEGSSGEVASYSAGAGWSNSSTPVASSNYIGFVGATGLVNISQNVGNNSVLQSANTVAAMLQSH